MGESRVMTHQTKSADEELLVEHVEIVDTEQTGGSEPDNGSTGNGSPNEGEGGGGGEENAPWHQDPKE
jgi:hypothetical protein